MEKSAIVMFGLPWLSSKNRKIRFLDFSTYWLMFSDYIGYKRQLGRTHILTKLTHFINLFTLTLSETHTKNQSTDN